MNSKQNFIPFSAYSSRPLCADIIQSTYAMSKVLSTQRLTENIEFA